MGMDGLGGTGNFFLNSDAVPNTESLRLLTVTSNASLGVNTSAPQATRDVNGYARLAKNSSEPVACSSTNDGAIALTHVYTLCICNGGSTGWVEFEGRLNRLFVVKAISSPKGSILDRRESRQNPLTMLV